MVAFRGNFGATFYIWSNFRVVSFCRTDTFIVKSEDRQNNPSVVAEAIGLLSSKMERLIMGRSHSRPKDSDNT